MSKTARAYYDRDLQEIWKKFLKNRRMSEVYATTEAMKMLMYSEGMACRRIPQSDGTVREIWYEVEVITQKQTGE